jgi:Uma2 family endonuclease
MEDLCQEFRSRNAWEVTVTAMIPTDHGPWTEEDYFALGESNDRIELFDGALYVSAAPTLRHQIISRRLANALDNAAEERGLLVIETINLRLKPGRIPIPDLVITSSIDIDDPVVPASALAAVCEITSPSNEAHDKVLKMHYYAEAGIPWYLLVEPKTVTMRLFRLEGTTYVSHAAAEPGEVLRLTEPVAVAIRPEDLLP